jgi:hypothetical protein
MKKRKKKEKIARVLFLPALVRSQGGEQFCRFLWFDQI